MIVLENDDEFTWNHRVVRLTYDGTLKIVEVDYNNKRIPESYWDAFLTGDSIDELKLTLKRMMKCLKEPIIDEKEFTK